MRRLIPAILLMTASPVLADDTTTSGQIAAQGLKATQADLQAQPASDDRDMALAAVTFLRGIETNYQTRWRAGLTEIPLPMPVIGTPVAPNPSPEPLGANIFNTMAADLGQAMQATRDVLPKGGDGALVLRLSDLWLDVDGNGAPSDDEWLRYLAGFPPPMPNAPAQADEVRFDGSDTHWLRAYTHLIEAGATLIRAFDPSPEIARTLALREAIAAQYQDLQQVPQPYGYFDYPLFADTAGVVINTLRHQPDPALIAETETHIRSMIADNREFWTAVAAETDNDREWIPNDSQQQALGLEIPPGTGAAWLGVLADAEKVLNGELLIPYWRFAPGHGINLRQWLDAPKPVEFIDWVQGTAALDYVGEGQTINDTAWSQFLSISEGNAGLYMVMFN